MAEVFSMNGYEIYVWSAYGSCLGLIVLMVAQTFWRQFRLSKQEKDFENRSRPPKL
mgnify:CR=1 FL=1